jgi:hypothetical protein
MSVAKLNSADNRELKFDVKKMWEDNGKAGRSSTI